MTMSSHVKRMNRHTSALKPHRTATPATPAGPASPLWSVLVRIDLVASSQVIAFFRTPIRKMATPIRALSTIQKDPNDCS